MVGKADKTVVRAGMLGAGAFMNKMHLPNAAGSPLYHIQAICDRDAERLAKAEADHNPEYVTPVFQDLLADPEIDVIFVGTKHLGRYRFLIEAADAGKHVLSEKPMTMDMHEARQVVDAVRANNVGLLCGFNRRFSPALRYAKELMPAERDGPAMLSYRISDNHRERYAYIFDMNDGGGHLLAEGCHIFDAVCWFLEEEPVEIYATGRLEVDNFVLMKMSGGSQAMILCGGAGTRYYPKERMEVFCSEVTVIMDNFVEVQARSRGQDLDVRQTFPYHHDDLAHLEPREGTEADWLRSGELQRAPKWSLQVLPDKGHVAEIECFARAILADTPSPCDEVAGSRATLLALKAYESIRTGQPVTVRPDEYFLPA